MASMDVQTPPKAKKRNRLIDVLLILVIVGSLAFAAWSYFKPSKIEVPEMTPTTASSQDVKNMRVEPVEITGSNSGRDENAPKQDPKDVKGVKAPAMGDEDKGQEGELTHDEEVRTTEGTVITSALSTACPNLANGAICFPSRKEVVYYHSVGTHMYKGVENMSIPSTYSAGWLKTTAPLGAEKGTSLFAAHVVFNGGIRGPFYNLPTTKSGEDIIVRDMQGRNWLYRVYKTAKVADDALPSDLYDTTGMSQIALVTCTGAWSNGRYQQRMLVYAVPVGVF